MTATAACQINKNGHEFTVADGFLALKNYNNANGYYDVKAVTQSTWRLAGTFKNVDKWEISTGAQYLYQITGTNDYVAPSVTLTQNDIWKFFKGANAWDEWVGSYSSSNSEDDVYKTMQSNTKTNKYDANSTYNNYKSNFGAAEGTYDIYLNVGTKYEVAKIWVEKL